MATTTIFIINLLCTFGSWSTPKKARAKVTNPLLAKRAALSSGTAPLGLDHILRHPLSKRWIISYKLLSPVDPSKDGDYSRCGSFVGNEKGPNKSPLSYLDF